MKDQQHPVVEVAARWHAFSDQFLDAAGYLAARGQHRGLPEVRMLGVALEYRLKAYICAVRAGTPRSDDLSRLARLAGYCGLVLTPEQFDGIAALNVAQSGTMEVTDVPDLEWAVQLCASIAEQATRTGS